jgi:uncharacterized protein
MATVVGLCIIELQFPHSASLKDKRQVLRSVVARVHNEFNVSIAEVGRQDAWQLGTLAAVCVSNDAGYVHGLLERVVHFVENGPFDLVLLDYQTELL